MSIAAVGELLRIWAAGHIEKGREITRSGPYRFVRHPLYLGSLDHGRRVSSWRHDPGARSLVVLYLGLTLWAAMRTEEATLDARFDGAYAEYREGRGDAVSRGASASAARSRTASIARSPGGWRASACCCVRMKIVSAALVSAVIGDVIMICCRQGRLAQW